MKKNSKVFESVSENFYDVDLEDLEMPKYVEKIELPEEKPRKHIASLVEDIWVPQPELVEKSLEELEKQDKEYRKRISLHNDEEKNKSVQLNIQRNVYKSLLELGLKLHTLQNFKTVEDYSKKLRKILKSLIKLQNVLSCIKDSKLKTLQSTCLNIWDWLAGLAREWSARVDLKIGADIIDQVMREAERKTDSEIQLFIMRELKSEAVSVSHKTTKKEKHKFSKHRKLKFDIHEKLQNFMTPEYLNWDSRSESLMKTLFGKKVESTEKVYLDIPLV